MKNHVILRTIGVMLLPFTFLFGFYVLFHGEISPGGGFQGGAIWATAVALHTILFSAQQTKKAFPPKILRVIAALGVLIYAGCGVLTMLLGGHFLDYAPIGQPVGILIIEIGVQLTVFAVLSLIFLRIASQEN